MNTKSRSDVLEKIAFYILDLKRNHPTRVAIDRITASGKSTFARDLTSLLQSSNRMVIATTLDGFHNPRDRRYEKGRNSPEGYYYDAYNYQAIVEHLLIPLCPNGNMQFKTEVFDLKSDRPTYADPRIALKDAILVVDGSFAFEV